MAHQQSLRNEALRFIQKLTNYTFHDESRLWEALQAAGYTSKDGNKDLALPGDAVFKVHLIMQGIQRHQSRGMSYLSTIGCGELHLS